MLRKQVYLTHNISFVRFAFNPEANTSGDCGRIGIEFSSQPNPKGWLLTLPKHREVISPQDTFCINIFIMRGSYFISMRRHADNEYSD